jgi:hypothetical protein
MSNPYDSYQKDIMDLIKETARVYKKLVAPPPLVEKTTPRDAKDLLVERIEKMRQSGSIIDNTRFGGKEGVFKEWNEIAKKLQRAPKPMLRMVMGYLNKEVAKLDSEPSSKTFWEKVESWIDKVSNAINKKLKMCDTREVRHQTWTERVKKQLPEKMSNLCRR